MQEDREFKANLCYVVCLMAVLNETCLRTFESYSPNILDPVGLFKHFVLRVQITSQNLSLILFQTPFFGLDSRLFMVPYDSQDLIFSLARRSTYPFFIWEFRNSVCQLPSCHLW